MPNNAKKQKKQLAKAQGILAKIMWDVTQAQRNIKTIAFREFNAL